MRAAFVDRQGGQLIVRDIESPPMGAQDVRLKVAACGITLNDIHVIDGAPYLPEISYPRVPGQELSGTVLETGSGVAGFSPGDSVIAAPFLPCGACTSCRSGRGNHCSSKTRLGVDRDGGFAEEVVLPAAQLFRLPSGIPLEEAAIIPDTVATPYHAVVKKAALTPGMTVAVFGCGGLGLLTVQIAAASGGYVIAVDVSEHKLELARQFGAMATINALGLDDMAAAIRPHAPHGVDVSIEVAGNRETMRGAFSALRRGGQVIVLGYLDKDLPFNALDILQRGITVSGSWRCGLHEFPRVMNMVATGRIRIQDMVTHRFSLDTINEAMDLLRKGDPGLIRAVCIP